VYLPDLESGGTRGDDVGGDASTPHESNALTSEMRSRIDFLEEKLRRKDAILMNMTEAMKALTASSETQESPQTSSEQQGSGTAYPEDGEVQKRSWWKRFFGVE
jgi:hypothetical protein